MTEQLHKLVARIIDADNTAEANMLLDRLERLLKTVFPSTD